MNNITKYNLKTIAISVTGLILLFCVLSFLIAPQSDVFQLESINPLGILEGTAFALSWGLGFPIWISIITIFTISFFIFMVFLWIARRVIK
ncbi:hypothetical protein BN938_1711 [Mucinivorans hirudinis]|uniref:Uncharacterized protein n=1 Tax=Mucinivorans hirudinis TaxID=1433126 RepID=A0A060R8G7_9BACT|nr:hypothetical protein BN938_1711 [Mucinivorans hirudinis]